MARECRQALTPHGTLVLNSGTGASGLAMLVRLARPYVLSPFVSQDLRRYLSHPNRADLTILTGLVEEGSSSRSSTAPICSQTSLPRFGRSRQGTFGERSSSP